MKGLSIINAGACLLKTGRIFIRAGAFFKVTGRCFIMIGDLLIKHGGTK